MRALSVRISLWVANSNAGGGNDPSDNDTPEEGAGENDRAVDQNDCTDGRSVDGSGHEEDGNDPDNDDTLEEGADENGNTGDQNGFAGNGDSPMEGGSDHAEDDGNTTTQRQQEAQRGPGGDSTEEQDEVLVYYLYQYSCY